MIARTRKLGILLAAVALSTLAVTGSTAGAQGGAERVSLNASMALEGSTEVIGWGKADIRAPSSWADPPGSYTFNAVNGTNFRNLVERVWFWPWWDEQGNRANWAFVWAYNCAFSGDGPPVCGDVAFGFVDYADPALADFLITCWWDGGVRPPGDDTWAICDAPNAHQNRAYVVDGMLRVQMAT